MHYYNIYSFESSNNTEKEIKEKMTKVKQTNIKNSRKSEYYSLHFESIKELIKIFVSLDQEFQKKKDIEQNK